MEELLKSIRYSEGRFHKHEIEALIEQKDEAIPRLIQILEEVLADPDAVIAEPTRMDHMYSVYLLAQFKAEEALSVIVGLFSLPPDKPYELFGDTITEDAGRILASVYDGDTGQIKALLENPKVDEYVRVQAAAALKILVFQGRLNREDVLNYYQKLLAGGLSDKHDFVLAGIVRSARDLYPEEIYPAIEKAYEDDLIDTVSIRLETVKKVLAADKDAFLAEEAKDRFHQYIGDAVKELSGWACFHKDYEVIEKEMLERITQIKKASQFVYKPQTIPRNKPCPCGSGKKYKLCCGE